MKLRIALADDHAIVASGVRLLLEQNKQYKVVAEASSPDELLHALHEHACDVVITDFCMPGKQADGLRLLQRIHQRWPTLSIFVLTQVGTPAVLDTIYNAAGVHGVVSKIDAIQELTCALEQGSAKSPYASYSVREQLATLGHLRTAKANRELSPREAEVIRLFAAGQSVSDIASLLNRSVKTISCQKQAAKRKLGVSSDRELYAASGEYMMGG